jgi:hypothetical protein
MSTRAIGRMYGLSHTALEKHADKMGWVRDLAPKIRSAADLKVAKAAGRGAASVSEPARTLTPEREQEVVEENAALQAGARLEMRQDIQRVAVLCNAMTAELESVTGRAPDLDRLIDSIGKLKEGSALGADVVDELGRILSLPSRVSSLAKLSVSLTRLIALKRQSLGIDQDDRKDESPFEALLKTIIAAEQVG